MLSWKTASKRDHCSHLEIRCELKQSSSSHQIQHILSTSTSSRVPHWQKVPMVFVTTSEKVLFSEGLLGLLDYYQVFDSSTGELFRVLATTSQDAL